MNICEHLPQATADVGLYVGLTLAALVILLSVAILLYCRTRLSKAKGEATGNTHTRLLSSPNDILTASFFVWKTNCFVFVFSEIPPEEEYASASQVSSVHSQPQSNLFLGRVFGVNGNLSSPVG